MKKRGPFKVTRTKVVYRNPWIEVREDSVVRPGGKKGLFGVVTMVPGNSILPLDQEGYVYLTKEYKYGVGRVTIEVISGAIDKGENRLESAKRELKEETGFIASKWTYLGVVDPFTTVVVSPNHLYLAERLERKKADSEELLRVIRVPFETAHRWVLESKITHSASVALILKAVEYLGKHESRK